MDSLVIRERGILPRSHPLDLGCTKKRHFPRAGSSFASFHSASISSRFDCLWRLAALGEPVLDDLEAALEPLRRIEQRVLGIDAELAS